MKESASFRFVAFDEELFVEIEVVDRTDGLLNIDRNGFFFGRNVVVDSDSVRRRRARSRLTFG